jgi:hypothetical protein
MDIEFEQDEGDDYISVGGGGGGVDGGGADGGKPPPQGR